MKPFWEKPLSELTQNEWEKLCDGCGRCCLHKFQDEDTNELLFTRVACRLLNSDTCRCTSYATRFAQVPDCMDIRTFSKDQYAWLPETCAYRLRFEGKQLPDWHPLFLGDKKEMLAQGVSISHRTVSESDEVLADLESYIDEYLK
ncbi:MAG: YcgN family cysteine cluster protein [Mariprofundaceae bacterium]